MKKAIPLAAVLVVGTAAYLTKGAIVPAEAPRGLQSAAQLTVPQAARAPEPATDARPIEAGSTVGFGLPVRRDRNCDVRFDDYVTADGEVFSAYSCTPHAPRATHPYEHYDNGSLEVLAYADPEAAALLGRRLAASDPDTAYDMLVRAAALDGNVDHLARLADQAFSAFRIDGALQVDNIKRRYELAALATRLGGDPAPARFLRSTLIEAGVNADSLGRLDDRVDALAESVRGIQRAVFGEIRYGGQTDA
ncbi:MAG: hypothetical protein QNJ23_01795 [Woeseiaceae bacterium]|nr:hypothetical protein [Woeseiaceae bacterium]